MTRFAAVALLCVLTSPAAALTCKDIRKAVTTYGQANVEWWARSKGYSEQFIMRARKCLAR